MTNVRILRLNMLTSSRRDITSSNCMELTLINVNYGLKYDFCLREMFASKEASVFSIDFMVASKEAGK